MANFEEWFEFHNPKIPSASVPAVLKLAQEGSTVPFIARYRKEQTGNLDEVGIQTIIDAHEKWEQILKRQQHILEQIEKQKKLTPELQELITSTYRLELLEDLYLPYKIKRKTKAAQAKESGLQPLADWIWNCAHGLDKPEEGQTLEIWAYTFRNEPFGILDASQAIEGAQDILVERLSEMQELRQWVRENMFAKAGVITHQGPKAKEHSKYESYFNYHESIASLLKPNHSHRYMAARRAWMEEELTMTLGGKPDEQGGDSGLYEILVRPFLNAACPEAGSPGDEVLQKAAHLALKAYVLPSIENEVHKALKTVADEAAITVFAENVRKLLLASPFGSKTVLGVDPGIRTGCKWSLVDASGKFVVQGVVHLQSAEGKQTASQILSEIVKQAQVQAVAVGNGTAGRETEKFLREALKDAGVNDVPVVMVNEAGASVYSASAVAREEFPDLDVTIRGAISIARRLQDPLAELVKIDPRSIGVGQYQHDVSDHTLKKSLSNVVDSCVNLVGVNLNTASESLLSHVSGIGPALAKAIVEKRAGQGLFHSRQELMEIPHFSQKTFEQAAGFLRIPQSTHPLDNTGVHPENYPIIEARAKALGKELQDLTGAGVQLLKEDDQFRQEVGPFTFEDIVRELEKPGRDPRESFIPFHFREDIHEIKDLQSGMTCPGIVTNVTNFGAFVDIGVHQDGLVQLSQLSDRFIQDAREVVSPGDRVEVRVLEFNLEKKQISLSMKSEQEKRPRPEPRQEKQRPARRNSAPRGGDRRPMQKPQRAKPIFNNAFADLAALRQQLKPNKK